MWHWHWLVVSAFDVLSQVGPQHRTEFIEASRTRGMRNTRERQDSAGSRCYFRPDRVKIPKTHLTRLSRAFPRPLQLHLRKSLIKYWRRNGKQHAGRRETKRKKHKQGRKSRRRRRIEARINALSLRNSVDLCTRRDRVHGAIMHSNRREL